MENAGDLYVQPGGYILQDDRIISLGIVGAFLPDIPPSIAQLESLGVPVFAEGGADEMTFPAGALHCLRMLALWGNAFTAVPPWAVTLPHLERFDLSSNTVSKLPAEWGGLVSLQNSIESKYTHVHNLLSML